MQEGLAPIRLSQIEASAALSQALGGTARPGRRGRFVLLHGPGFAASAPRAALSAPRRAGAMTGCAALLGARDTPLALARLATALRQEVGRALQPGRGLAPVALAEPAAEGVRLTALAVWLDGAAAAPGALDALQQIFHDSRRWTAWVLHVRD